MSKSILEIFSERAVSSHSTVYRLTIVDSLPLHKEYLKSTTKEKNNFKSIWMIGYVMSYLNCDEKQAELILKLSRLERTKEEQKAYDGARAKFKYHIIRD
jgi:hypothetical protein